MAIYVVEDAVFEIFPAFRRGVVMATGINNSDVDPETADLLSQAISKVSQSPTNGEMEKISVWNAAFTRMGMDPAKLSPSIRFLYEQIHRGRPPRPINKVVNLFNKTSIEWVAPCGGDDLNSLHGGDLCLGFSRGDETFVPLFKPTAVERIAPGELTYFCPQTREALCRRWVWRNSHTTRLTSGTRAVALNLDFMMPPFCEADLEAALGDLAASVARLCGGDIHTHILSPTNRSFHFDA